VLATFNIEPIIAHLDDPDCNNPAKNEGEWVHNENVAFDYSLCLGYVFESVDISYFYRPLPISKIACMHIEDNEGSVFIVPPSKRDQSSIIFRRGKAQPMTSKGSGDDLEPYNSFIMRDRHTT